MTPGCTPPLNVLICCYFPCRMYDDFPDFSDASSSEEEEEDDEGKSGMFSWLEVSDNQ